MVLLRKHTLKDTFNSKYNPVSEFEKKISDKAFEAQDNLGKVE